MKTAKQVDVHIKCFSCGKPMTEVQAKCHGEPHSHYCCLACGGTIVCVVPRFRLDGRVLSNGGAA